MENYNERQVYINRTPVDMTAGHRFIAYETNESFKLLDTLTLVEFKIFNYLMSLNPHTINGKNNPKAQQQPYKLLPAALHNVYPSTSAQSFKKAIGTLIDKGFLKTTSIPDLYQFDNRPAAIRDTSAEVQLSAEQAYNETII